MAKFPSMMGEPTPAEEVGYARVSDADDQSPDMQVALLKARGIPDENIFVDLQSGRSMERPGLRKALMLMEGRPGWTLVVYKLDRLGRNTLGLMELMREFEQKGWNLVSLTEQLDTRTALGRVVFTIMAAFAQLESDLISERTKAGVARRRELGYPVGRPPKLNRAQFERLERALIDEKDKTLLDLAKRFDVSEQFIRVWFPNWRAATPEERAAFRATKPFPQD